VASGLEVPTTLATALSYGITSETQDLGREAREADLQAYLALFPKTNKKILAAIVHPRLPREFFVILSRALHHSRVYKNSIATTLGEVPNPDFVPLVADFILRCERMNWSLCIGRYNGRLLTSIRTTNKKGQAGKFLRQLVGKRGTAGGHGMIAGGQVPCSMEEESCAKVEEELIEGFLKKLGYGPDVETTPLLVGLPPNE
jgi:nanoRNase/pAp phosphatase (c-di-AMP/oligoRNAs hydrolase)